MANFPAVDSFLNTYNANGAALEKIARGASSFEAAKNYAKNEFSGLKMQESTANADKISEAKFDAALREQTDAFEAFLIKSIKISEAKFDAALREQTDAFEAFLIKSILDISLKKKVSLFGKDASDEIYSSMYNDAMSQALGGGLGISEILFNYLKERA